MSGQWKLNDKTIDLSIIIEELYQPKQFLFSCIFRQFIYRGSDTNRLTRFFFSSNIGLTCRIFPYDDCCEMRSSIIRIYHAGNFRFDFHANLLRDLLSVNYFHLILQLLFNYQGFIPGAPFMFFIICIIFLPPPLLIIRIILLVSSNCLMSLFTS